MTREIEVLPVVADITALLEQIGEAIRNATDTVTDPSIDFVRMKLSLPSKSRQILLVSMSPGSKELPVESMGFADGTRVKGVEVLWVRTQVPNVFEVALGVHFAA